MKKGEYRWSRLVGAYVGPAAFAARGVPPRFLNPGYKPPGKMLRDEPATGTGEEKKDAVAGEGAATADGG